MAISINSRAGTSKPMTLHQRREREMTYAAARADGFLETDFRLGKVISKSIEVFLKNIVTFTLIASLMLLPSIPTYTIDEQADPALTAYTVEDQADLTATDGIILLVAVALIFALWPLVSAVILYAAFQHMRGRKVRLAEAVARVLPRSLALVGVMFLGGLGMMIGLVALVVPGIFLMVIWYVAGAACVAEKLGMRQSLRRSRELTKGYRWRIFALVLLILSATAIGSGLALATQTAGMNVWAQMAVDLVWQGLSGGFTSVLVAVSYYYLRVAKEGVDVEQIAAVFD
jgi:hypothetical protein